MRLPSLPRPVMLPAMAPLAVLVLAAAWLAAAAPALAIVPSVLSHAGTLLADRGLRRAELERLPPAERAALCGDPATSWPHHPPEIAFTAARQPGQELALTLMRAGGVVLAFDDAAARAAILDNLGDWASHAALRRLEGKPVRAYYNLDRTLLPMIGAFALVHDDARVSARRIAVIERWLGDRVEMRRRQGRFDDPDRVSSRNNHRYLADSVTMAWGALTGDPQLLAAGIERYEAALAQMRDDGSLPLETARGRLALHYQRHAIGSLVTIAEIAGAQGIDLYARQNAHGRTIHDMVAFLADAIADRRRLAPYTTAEQNLGFLQRRGHDRHYMAWLEAYAARFPASPATLALRRLVAAEADDAAPGPLLDDYVMGNATCRFAPSTIAISADANGLTDPQRSAN